MRSHAENEVNNQLDAYMDRYENLNAAKNEIQEDIKELKSEIKLAGFDVKIFSATYKLKQMEDNARQEHDYLMDTYRQAAGIPSK
jgi:uncharacterized protein (UPF0335 family)